MVVDEDPLDYLNDDDPKPEDNKNVNANVNTGKGLTVDLKFTQIPFRGKTIEVGAYVSVQGDFRIQLALLEVLGLPYLEALDRQNVHMDVDGQIRKILEEEEKNDG